MSEKVKFNIKKIDGRFYSFAFNDRYAKWIPVGVNYTYKDAQEYLKEKALELARKVLDLEIDCDEVSPHYHTKKTWFNPKREGWVR